MQFGFFEIFWYRAITSYPARNTTAGGTDVGVLSTDSTEGFGQNHGTAAGGSYIFGYFQTSLASVHYLIQSVKVMMGVVYLIVRGNLVIRL